MTTFRCARCGATLESTGPAEAEAWADEHTDTEHGDEARWPNSFAITYPGSQIPGVHYRWPHGWDPRTAFYNATTGAFLRFWGGHGDGNGQFVDGGRGLTMDGSGNVWVADMPGFRTQKFTPQGQFLLASGLLDLAHADDEVERLRRTAEVKRLTLPGEMGERFQAIAFSRGLDDVLSGLRLFDLSRRL